MLVPILPSWRVLVVIVVVTEMCIGWIPWFIAAHRRTRFRFWIALSGFLTAPLLLLFLGVLFWALLSPTTLPEGPGFPVQKDNFGAQ